MHVLRALFGFFLALTLLTSCMNTPVELNPSRVLFVGNSYTYQHDLPELVRRASQPGQSFETGLVAAGGQNLITYVDSERLQTLLDTEDWDVIVLQDRSTATFCAKGRADFERALAWFRRAADQEGASLILYQTWPRRKGHDFYSTEAPRGCAPPRDQMDMLEQLIAAYARGAKSTKARIAPVGECWMKQGETDHLYAEDGSHASAAGANLAARVIANTLAGKADPCA